MLKTIKKLFSVDDSELDFDTEDVHHSQNESSNEKYSPYNANNSAPDNTMKMREINVENNTTHHQQNKNNINNGSRYSNEKNIVNNVPNIVSHNIKSDSVEDKITKSTDNFTQEIELAYNQSIIPESKPASYVPPVAKPTKQAKPANTKTAPQKKQVEVKSNDKTSNADKKAVVKKPEATKKIKSAGFIPRDVSELVTKENFKLMDIIKPMSGVTKKANNEVLTKSESKPPKTGIIKLRENYKVTDLEESTELEEKIEEVVEDKGIEKVTKKTKKTKNNVDESTNKESLHEELEVLKAKSKNTVDNKKVKDEEKSPLHVTTGFTIIEDSTGEIELVYSDDIIE
ncbi:hypothetical protein [Mycoplasma sp. P36-A1]|uniref:hypothetical protein n=1 Tax=Mycoplasma sp. P36-A1 TaxID=3252900 RepID=UPI003C2ABD43